MAAEWRVYPYLSSCRLPFPSTLAPSPSRLSLPSPLSISLLSVFLFRSLLPPLHDLSASYMYIPLHDAFADPLPQCDTTLPSVGTQEVSVCLYEARLVRTRLTWFVPATICQTVLFIITI